LSPSDGPEREHQEVSMNAFLIDLDNKVGELARVTEAIAAKGVNITAVSGSTCGDGGSVAIMTADEAATRAALQDARCSFREIEATETAIRNVPGALAKVCRRLAEGGLNIDALLPTGMQGDDVTVTFLTSDPAKARNILSHAGSASG
jgi:hypothetical protein